MILNSRASVQVTYVTSNIKDVKELANLNVRKAMTMAIDRETVTKDVLKDGSAPTYTAVPPQFATGPDGSDYSKDQEKYSDVCKYDAKAAADYWEKGLEELGVKEVGLQTTPTTMVCGAMLTMMRSSQNVQPVTFAQMQKDVGQNSMKQRRLQWMMLSLCHYIHSVMQRWYPLR